jgi:cation diffusion facilitator family transporter
MHAHAEQGPGRLTPEHAARITSRTAAASVSVALALIALKAAAWLFSGSVAMLASLADSGLDLLASLFTLLAVRYAAAPPDAEHRFGHGKAEGLASLVQGAFVLVSATLVAVEAFQRLVRPQPVHSEWLAIGVMLASTALTAGLIWLQTRALRRTGSIATAGDRAHYLSDFFANLAVLAGLAGASLFGLAWADPAAGLLVAAYLLHAGWQVWRSAADHLMDRELPDAERARILALVAATPGVLDAHALRTRASGSSVHIQLHVDVDARITVAAAHAILVEAERRIREVYPAADVLIHADPHEGKEAHGAEILGEEA